MWKNNLINYLQTLSVGGITRKHRASRMAPSLSFSPFPAQEVGLGRCYVQLILGSCNNPFEAITNEHNLQTVLHGVLELAWWLEDWRRLGHKVNVKPHIPHQHPSKLRQAQKAQSQYFRLLCTMVLVMFSLPFQISCHGLGVVYYAL